MTKWLFAILVSTITFTSAGSAMAEGDRFYHSTWYATPSKNYEWLSQSVVHSERWRGAYDVGPYSTYSNRSYYPGFGYAGNAMRSWRTGIAYEPTWSYGILQPYHTSNGIIDTNGTLAPTVIPGTVHLPWYFPGSPGNARSSLTGH